MHFVLSLYSNRNETTITILISLRRLQPHCHFRVSFSLSFISLDATSIEHALQTNPIEISAKTWANSCDTSITRRIDEAPSFFRSRALVSLARRNNWQPPAVTLLLIPSSRKANLASKTYCLESLHRVFLTSRRPAELSSQNLTFHSAILGVTQERMIGPPRFVQSDTRRFS